MLTEVAFLSQIEENLCFFFISVDPIDHVGTVTTLMPASGSQTGKFYFYKKTYHKVISGLKSRVLKLPFFTQKWW